MSTTDQPAAATFSAVPDLADAAVALARHWSERAAELPEDAASARLSGLLGDPRGLDFAVGFVDGVIRPEDPQVAAHNWAEVVAEGVPEFLPWYLRRAVSLGSRAARVQPRWVVPIAKRALRHLVGHLVIDASPAGLGKGVARLRAEGMRPNLNLLGEAVLGSQQAKGRLAGTLRLLQRGDVDYVSVKVSAVVAPHSPWAFEENVADVVEQLLPLYRAARGVADGSRTFVNLDMEEYHDLDLTIAVFTTLLDREEFADLEAGIVLQAYLPDSLVAMQHLQHWAARRVAAGGAPIKVRVVKGANLPMERVESAVRGWPLATWGSKQQTDAHYLRVLDWALTPDRVRNVRLGVAGHNLFDLAWVRLLAQHRGVEDGPSGFEFEMLLGMAPAVARTIREETGSMLLYTPVVRAAEFDVAIAYLIRRLEEGATPDNFLASMFDLDQASAFEIEEERFRAALGDLDESVPQPNRDQDRSTERPEPLTTFENVADTDPSLAANRTWGREILAKVPGSLLGADLVAEHTITDPDTLDDTIAAARAAGVAWGQRPAAERAEILRRAGAGIRAARGELLEVMAAECGKTLDQGDPEVSEAADFASYYADLAERLPSVDGAEFAPRALTSVTPPWNFPVAIPAGSTLAALAAGSAVLFKPAPQAVRCGSVLARILWQAGVPREVLRLVHVAESGDSGLAGTLISDPRVDQVILTGGYETAELFHHLRPGVRLFAETSGKNALVVTPAADLDLAAKDLVASAFGHAGQKCSAASLGILVGSVATSRRFLDQLVDATRSLVVDLAADPRAQMGPLIEPPGAKLLAGLTRLAPGESWLLQPRQLDETGRLWSPGIRAGVRPGSAFHRTEYFGPVLGLMAAADLGEAIDWQNAVDYGLTAGLHSLDVSEQRLWLDRVQAGNLYVNRGITGAIVRRQPFGGWKRSAVGPGTKAGGPHYLFGLGEWTSRPAAESAEEPSSGFGHDALVVLGGAERERMVRSLASDERAWTERFGAAGDVSDLVVEANVLRYIPTPVTIRSEAAASRVDLLRVVAAGLRGSAEIEVSAVALAEEVVKLLRGHGIGVRVQSHEDWLVRVARTAPARVRLVGATAAERDGLVAQQGPLTAVWDHAVTESGEVELLPFLHEQAVSLTRHRFGTVLATPVPLS